MESFGPCLVGADGEADEANKQTFKPPAQRAAHARVLALSLTFQPMLQLIQVAQGQHLHLEAGLVVIRAALGFGSGSRRQIPPFQGRCRVFKGGEAFLVARVPGSTQVIGL